MVSPGFYFGSGFPKRFYPIQINQAAKEDKKIQKTVISEKTM